MLIFFATSSDFPRFFNSSDISFCSFSIIFLSKSLISNDKGFYAAICIDSCLSNKSTLSEFSFETKETITANLDKLSFTIVCL